MEKKYGQIIQLAVISSLVLYSIAGEHIGNTQKVKIAAFPLVLFTFGNPTTLSR